MAPSDRERQARAATTQPSVITVADVEAAAHRLEGIAHRTPLITSRTLDDRIGTRVHVKAECFQRGGAFKLRGAYNRISAVPPGRDVVAFSSGNHAQAVALAARLQGCHATVVMPSDAPAAKVDATLAHGAEIVPYDRFTEDREAIARRLSAERDLELVPPYDDPLVMAGQGTVALEMLDQEPGLDLLVVPLGGGGLLAGCATVAKARRQGIRVIGVEPEAGNDTALSLAAGERTRIGAPRTICDGLGAPEPGRLTFEVNRRLVDAVVTVSDQEAVDAMAFLFDRMKLVAEPSGAVGIAALLAGRIDVGSGARPSAIGVIVSGGNVGALHFAELINAHQPC